MTLLAGLRYCVNRRRSRSGTANVTTDPVADIVMDDVEAQNAGLRDNGAENPRFTDDAKTGSDSHVVTGRPLAAGVSETSGVINGRGWVWGTASQDVVRGQSVDLVQDQNQQPYPLYPGYPELSSTDGRGPRVIAVPADAVVVCAQSPTKSPALKKMKKGQRRSSADASEVFIVEQTTGVTGKRQQYRSSNSSSSSSNDGEALRKGRKVRLSGLSPSHESSPRGGSLSDTATAFTPYAANYPLTPQGVKSIDASVRSA